MTDTFQRDVSLGRFDFNAALLARVKRPAAVVPVFNHTLMQGEAGARALVKLPRGLFKLTVNSHMTEQCFIPHRFHTYLPCSYPISRSVSSSAGRDIMRIQSKSMFISNIKMRGKKPASRSQEVNGDSDKHSLQPR